MKPVRLLLMIWLLCNAILVSYGQGSLSKVKIYAPKDRAERANLLGTLEIDHFAFDKDGAMIVNLTQQAMELLPQTKVKYEVLVPDVSKWLQRENQKYYDAVKAGVDFSTSRVALEQPGKDVNQIIKTPAAFAVQPGFGGYMSFAQMTTAMNNLVAAYPAIASKTSIGTTMGGNNLWLIKISDNVATDEANEPEVIFLGLQHAREAITGASMIFFMQYLCENYATDARIKDLIDNREIYIIPCFNPDGWEFNRTSEGGAPGGDWRKNRRPNVGGTFGVDLNRNWGVDWGNCSAPILGNPSSCGTSTKSADTYWGTGAFSENENAAVKAFVQTHHIVAGFDQHAFGPYYSLPFGRHSLHTMSLKGTNFYTAIPALMGTYNGMRAADSYDALGYEVAGGFKDWMLMGDIGTGTKDTVYAMTGEGAAGGGGTDPNIITNGTQDFWAPASQIIYLSKGMCYQNLQLLYAAGTYVDIQDNSDIAMVAKSGNMSVNVRRLGLGDNPVTITLLPLENVKTVGAPVTINSMPVYYQTQNVNIPYTLFTSLTNGQRVRYIWKVTTSGYSYSDTITRFYNPTSLFYDDMESAVLAPNWTNVNLSADPAYTSGGTNYFGYTYTSSNWVNTTGGIGASRALSESAAGSTYSTRSIRCLQYAKSGGTFDLSDATAAYLTFWTRHRIENFNDKCQVQVSTNGTTWTAVSGTTTIQESTVFDGSTLKGQPGFTGIRDYYTQETFNLGAYIGAPALRLRFVFTSDNDASGFTFETDDGIYIDNLRMIKSTAQLYSLILPVEFTSVSGQLLPDNTIRVNWEATIDLNHDYFEVEKSTNGTNFSAIGQVRGFPPYQVIDKNPSTGNNYYRIKQVDKNGKASYSKVINVVYSPGVKLTVYPNPIPKGEAFYIRVDNIHSEELNVRISDVQGRTVYQQTVTDVQNGREIMINTDTWHPNVYILRATNERGELITTQKIIKQ